MIRLTLTAFALLFLSLTASFAACIGEDLRATFSPAQRTELETRIARIPYPEGNHWRATKGDVTLHLIGTVHMNDPRLDAVIAHVGPLIDAAQVVWVEATPEEEAKLQNALVTQPDLVFLTTGPTLIELMLDDDWSVIAAAAQDRGIPPFMAAKFRPWYLSLSLAMPACVMAEINQGVRGLDDRVVARAKTAQVPVKALEPFDTVFRLMSDTPMEEQITMLQAGVFPDKAATDGVTTMMASYLEEKPAEVFEVSRITAKGISKLSPEVFETAFEDMQDVLLSQRNEAWMEHIRTAQPGLTVVAVGAGHLPGERGLLKLLENEGFDLDRQTFTAQ